MHDSFVNNHWVCIVGALASSCDTLPENMAVKTGASNKYNFGLAN